MTKNFSDMIYLFSCGAMGIEPELKHEIDFDAVYRHAVSQGVWNTVFLAVKKLYVSGKLNIDSDKFKSLKHQTFAAIASNTRRTYAIHDLMRKLQDNNINFCVLKGETLSYLYNEPDCRISSDTDILIDKEDKDKACKILSDFGFDIGHLNPDSHHISARHHTAGLLELHLNLYDELFEDVWFDNKTLNQEENRILKTGDGIEIPTLGITDGLIFVTLHCIKHFLFEGVGTRQIMDILLYMKTYRTQIDWERFDNLMKHLKYSKFIDNIIGIGDKYLNFNKEQLPEFECDENIMIRMLSDIEGGGVFGKNEKKRFGFYLAYTRARVNTFKKDDSHYINKWWRSKLINKFFPHIKTLEPRFPYVKKTPLLYPVAWVHMILNLIISIIKKEKPIYMYIDPGGNHKNNEVIENRMDLIRELDMI